VAVAVAVSVAVAVADILCDVCHACGFVSVMFQF
jgi:hypothetical protein